MLLFIPQKCNNLFSVENVVQTLFSLRRGRRILQKESLLATVQSH